MRIIRTVFVLILVSVFINCSAQNIQDTLISGFRDFYVNKLKYKLEKIVDVEIPADGKMPHGNDIPCYSGKEVLVIALFSAKPQELYGRMLVSKKYNGKIDYDEHPIQLAQRWEDTQNYYAPIDVMFPKEANNLNCSVLLQVYDKKNSGNQIKLMVFTR